MECGKIVITRLRNTEYYKGEPLNHIVDSIYQLLDNFIVEYDTEEPVVLRHIIVHYHQEKRIEIL
mgnify:CR=1 FL=1